MDSNIAESIREIYNQFKKQMSDIQSRKKSLLNAYHTKLEEAKIKQLKEFLGQKREY